MSFKNAVILTLVLSAVCAVAGQNSVSGTAQSLTVTTEAGARIWVDGVLRGVTDEKGRLAIKPISKGPHSLRVAAFGFKEVSRPVTATETSLSVPLTKTFDPSEIAYQNGEQMMAEDKSKAIDFYKEAVRLRPDYTDAWLGLTRAYADTGDYDSALETVEKARKIRPVFPELSAVEGRIYRSDGDIDKAIESFERAIREGKGFQPEAHTGLALIFKEEAESARARGEYDIEKLYYEDAAKSFETAIEQLSATEPVVYLLLGQIYEDTRQKKKAIAIYERFLRDLPDNAERTAVESFIVQLKKPDRVM